MVSCQKSVFQYFSIFSANLTFDQDSQICWSTTLYPLAMQDHVVTYQKALVFNYLELGG